MKRLDDNKILTYKTISMPNGLAILLDIMLVEELHRNMKAGKQTDVILLDFSKAFNKVK